jgi:apolipoprotein N-acyltransferase
MPKYFHLAYQSFWGKILRPYFNTSIIINAFVTAFFLSLVLLFEYLSFGFWPLHVSAFLIGFGRLLTHDKIGFFWTGAFIGLFWFYWISWSFIHYGFAYLIPLGILGVMAIYGVLFWVCGIFSSHPLIKAIALFGFGFIAPFGFNWFDWRLFLIDTPFRVDMFGIGLLMLGIALFLSTPKKIRYLALLLPLLALEINPKNANFLPKNIKLVNTFIPQSQKWNPQFREPQIESIFRMVESAISRGESLIIFPESAFPLYLNHNLELREKLLAYSHSINIIAGSLTHTDEGIYNSAYFFHKGDEEVAHKVILVPFGEQVPLPQFFRDLINRVFYGGASDFLTAKNGQNFKIFGLHVRSAICFEATRKELFIKTPGIMIALSNNAWFTPSIEPYLQRRLLRLYSTMHETTIYHSVNGSSGGIITPYNSPLLDYFNKALNSFI